MLKKTILVLIFLFIFQLEFIGIIFLIIHIFNGLIRQNLNTIFYMKYGKKIFLRQISDTEQVQKFSIKVYL